MRLASSATHNAFALNQVARSSDSLAHELGGRVLSPESSGLGTGSHGEGQDNDAEAEEEDSVAAAAATNQKTWPGTFSAVESGPFLAQSKSHLTQNLDGH